MANRSREQWLGLFKEFEQSDPIASEFCRQRDLCPRYFSKRKKQLGFSGQQKPVTSKLLKIIPAKPIAASSQTIILQYGGSTLCIPSSLPTEWIANLVKALAQ